MKGKVCKIKGASRYFSQKYGTPNPEIVIEDTDVNVCGRSWMDMTGNPAAMLFGMRSGTEGLPFGGAVYYGKIGGMGELVHESELEVIE